MRAARALALAAFLLAGTLAGCSAPASGPDPAWRGRDIRAGDPAWREWPLDTGWSFLAVLDLKAGDVVPYDWFVVEDQEIRFRVMEDEPTRVKVLQDGHDVQGKGSFTAPEDGTYALVWSDAGPPLQLHYQVRADADVGERGPGDDPGDCAPVLGLQRLC